MKSWILNKLSILENYFFVEKKLKEKIDIWCVVYCAFICSYLLFVVEYNSASKLISTTIIILIGVFSFFSGSIFNRFRLIFLIVLVNPLLISLLYPIEERFIKLILIFVIILVILISKNDFLLKASKLIFISNIIFCVILIYKYYESSYFYKIKNPPIAELITEKDKEKDIYVIILDGFPSKSVLKKYYNTHSKLLDYFDNNSFVEKKPLSKYTDTYNSLPNIFSGAIFTKESIFRKKDIAKISQTLPGNYLMNYTKSNDYQLSFTSFFIDQNSNALNITFGRGADFSIYIFSLIERFILYTNPDIKFRRNEEIENVTSQNIHLIKEGFNSQNKILSVNHFLTFHTNPSYDSKTENSVLINLDYADKIGLSVIKMIENEKPNAKIIVLSDHGVKGIEIKPLDHYQSILYIKN